MKSCIRFTFALALPCLAGTAFAQSYLNDALFADSFEVMGACPAQINTPNGARALLYRSDISYGVTQPKRANMNLDQWDNLWGYNNTTSPMTPWPGVGGASPVVLAFRRGSYFGAHFKTPSVAAGMSGNFVNPSFFGGPNVTMAISTVCGDFSNYLPTPGCLREDVPTSDANLVLWKFTSNASDHWCNLQPDTHYYVNIKNTDPTSNLECPPNRGTCPVAPLSYHN